MDARVELRVFGEDDLDFLDRTCTDPEALGDFQWHGFIDPRTRRKRWETDRGVGTDSTILAAIVDDALAGIVSWLQVNRMGPPGVCYEIGVALVPEFRGGGLGAEVHRAVVDHLFRYTVAHRLEASVEAGNVAEERTLEKLGFIREGVLHEVGWRDGAWRDGVIYALLRPVP